jgi:hypothetical protein
MVWTYEEEEMAATHDVVRSLTPEEQAVLLSTRAWAAAKLAVRDGPVCGPAHQALLVLERALLDAVAALERSADSG